ncbi:unnamed protein product [Lactuca saligna]|uniref:Replication factor A C-terminal domain-containing protein n=1 Tax=Lactuca saligna TaxID=75948 RepID=A0AA36ELQ0_LACSI|nr:unnamed protein product [Lactuca saligna]
MLNVTLFLLLVFCVQSIRPMAQPNVTLIADLDVLKDDSTIKVKVINLWNLFSFYNNDELFSIELILIDEQGTKIQGNVTRKNIYRFKNILKDGLTFYIKCPSFASQRMGGFTLTRQDHKLSFVHDTVVTECHDFSGPTFGFEFVDYQSIISLVHPENIAIDVIGLVVAFGEMVRDNDDKKKHRLNIQIQDANGLQLNVNLWGDFAYKMQHFLDNNPHNLRIIVILQFAKLSIWRDRPTVNTYFSVSKLFINTDIDEINVFNKSLDGDDRPDSSTNTLTCIKSNKVSENDDFMVNFQLKTISEISEPLEKNTFIIVGTIKGILQNENWHYLSCTSCNYKAFRPPGANDQPNADGFFIGYECHNKDCTKTETSVIPRFMIPLRVQDNTGTVTLTMFERDGKYLLKKSAKDLFNKTLQLGFRTSFYLGEINALKGLKLAFKITIKHFNISKRNNQYSICRVSDDEKLIEELENKFTVSQIGTSQSFDIAEADFESQENRIMKDAISRTDDNITPETVDKNSATSPMKSLNTPTILKTNLEEVFDLEMNEKLSSTKTPKISLEGGNNQIVKVKLEKSG